VFSLGANTKKLSMAGLNDVNCNEYANAYMSKLSIKGAVNANWTLDYSIIGVTAQDRDATSDFPSVTASTAPFTFHEASGTGYVRLGDTADVLAAGDNIDIEDFNLDIITGFDEQMCNSRGILTPTFGMVQPSCSGSFKISRHSADTILGFRDNHTPVQMSVYIYKSATATILIEIPYMVLKASLTDDDVVKIAADMSIGRNGIGTSYLNAYMTFTSPVRITVVNS
jgi:hypothetical protein